MDGRHGSLDIYANVLDAQGQRLYPDDLRVSTRREGFRWNPTLGVDPLGRVVIAWEERIDSQWHLYVNVLDAQGQRLYPEELEVTTTAGAHESPALAVDATGRAVLTWMEQRSRDIYATQLQIETGAIGFDADLATPFPNGPDRASLRFLRGDADGNGQAQLTDAVVILHHLFFGGAAPSPLDAADVNDDGTVDIADAIFLLNHLFLGGPMPPAPYPAAGVDPTPDPL
jgi:hypothetical protein